MVEHKNRHIFEVGRVLVFTMLVPKLFWVMLSLQRHIINRISSSVLNFNAPHAVLVDSLPFILFLLGFYVFVLSMTMTYLRENLTLNPYNAFLLLALYSNGVSMFYPHLERSLLYGC